MTDQLTLTTAIENIGSLEYLSSSQRIRLWNYTIDLIERSQAKDGSKLLPPNRNIINRSSKWVYYNDGKRNVKVRPGELLPDGFTKGRFMNGAFKATKEHDAASNIHWWNDGVNNRLLNGPGPEGWRRGRTMIPKVHK